MEKFEFPQCEVIRLDNVNTTIVSQCTTMGETPEDPCAFTE